MGALQPRFALANRPAIEAEIERLIELLDVADGDCDLEPDELDAEHDGAEPERGVATPIYGKNQADGPVNGAAASIEHYAAQIGAVRSPSGGWRIP